MWPRQGEHRTQSTSLLLPLTLSVIATSREDVDSPAASGALEDIRHDQDCQEHQNNLKPFEMQCHVPSHGPSDTDRDWHDEKHYSKTGLNGGLDGPVHFPPACVQDGDDAFDHRCCRREDDQFGKRSRHGTAVCDRVQGVEDYRCQPDS